jgi:hypothetical protein
MALEYDVVLHDGEADELTLEGRPTDPESCYLLEDVQGLDARDLREEVLDLPDRDGDYLGGVRSGGLGLIPQGSIVGVDRDDLRARERALRAAVVASQATWPLRVADRVGDPEDLVADVRTSQPFRCKDANTDSQRMKVFQVALRAADAVLYGAALHTVTTFPSAAEGGYDFPLDFPLEGGGSAIDLGELAQNDGDGIAWPVLSLYGPMTGPIRAENLTSGLTVVLAGNLAEGDVLRVEARAALPVTLNGASAYHLLNRADSTLWPLVVGANQVRVRAAASSDNARLEVSWRNAYL